MRDPRPWLSLSLLGACLPARPPAPVVLSRDEPVPDSAMARGFDTTAVTGRADRFPEPTRPMRLRTEAFAGSAVWVWIEALAPGQTSEILPRLPDWTLAPLLPE